MTEVLKKTYSKNLVEKVQVLISTMNRENPIELAKQMRVNSFVIINQITKKIGVPKDIYSINYKIISVMGRGLSRSRNKALLNSDTDICVLADDDMDYVAEYESIIANGYKKYPDADIIAFFVDSDDERQLKKKLKEGRLNLFKTMKIASWNITFRRINIIESGIKFDENFGTGTNNYMGEENILLFDCYKKGLKIYYIPTKIATIRNSESTWFNGYDKKYFSVKGRVFFRMSSMLWPILVIQFALRKKKLYKKQLSTSHVLRLMFLGAYDEMRCSR
jgi:glycosyltransferase involved in cell wall biosynthesis